MCYLKCLAYVEFTKSSPRKLDRYVYSDYPRLWESALGRDSTPLISVITLR